MTAYKGQHIFDVDDLEGLRAPKGVKYKVMREGRILHMSKEEASIYLSRLKGGKERGNKYLQNLLEKRQVWVPFRKV